MIYLGPLLSAVTATPASRPDTEVYAVTLDLTELASPTPVHSRGLFAEPLPDSSSDTTLVIRPQHIIDALPFRTPRNRAERHAGMRRRRAL